MENFYDFLKQLTRIPSVVGEEHSFFMYIKRELEDMNISVEYYDGLLVAKGNAPEVGYISAHADRHGLICTGHNEFQYAAYIAKNRADLMGNSTSEQVLNNFSLRFVGQRVQAYEPWSGSYLGIGTIQEAFLCQRRNNVIFKVDNFEHLFPGTPIAFMDKLVVENGLVSAQIDNTISIATILYLYALGYQGTAFFTASEEAGKSWRFLLEYFRRFDLTTKELLVLDTSPYKDENDLNQLDIVLRNRDENAYFRSPLKSKIKKIALKNRIKYHYKDEYIKNIMKMNNEKTSLGVTELGRIIKASKGSIQGTTLQFPTIGYHTINETTSTKSIEAVLKVLKTLYAVA